MCAVYVDNMEAQFGRMKMCHMIADSTDELLSMADSIGVQRKWIQYPHTAKEHFDIAKSKRRLAIFHGAVNIDMRQLAAMELRRMVTGNLGSPDDAEDWLDEYYKSKMNLDESKGDS